MPRRPNPVDLAEAMAALEHIHSEMKHLLKGRLGPNTKKQLKTMCRLLRPLIRRHYGKRH